MKQFFYLAGFCVLTLLTACKGGFKKGQNGLEYKIVAMGGKEAPHYGDYIQMHIKRVYSGTKDTVLMDTHEFMPKIQIFDSVKTPLEYYNIIRQMKKGDSLVFRLLSDSAYKNQPEGMPPFIKKGKYIYTYFRLVNIFRTLPEADSANKAEYFSSRPRVFKKQFEEIGSQLTNDKEQMKKDDKIITDYLAKNNIKAEKTKWGTYVSVITEGTGQQITGNSIVSVNYTGRTLDSGKVFDSNVDPKFNHVRPYDVNMGELGTGAGVIFGWTDALLQLRAGSKAVIFIPSSLAYGKSGNGEIIKPNDCIIFDIEIKDAITEKEAIEKQEKAEQERQQLEKMRQDSILNATKK